MASFPPIAKGYRPRCYFDVEINGVSGMVCHPLIIYFEKYFKIFRTTNVHIS